MADYSQFRETMHQEELVIHRGLALLGGILAGIGTVFFFLQQWSGMDDINTGMVNYLTLGLQMPQASLRLIVLIVAGILGGVIGEWVWLGLAVLQRTIAPIPAPIAFKRAALPFAVFLPLITMLVQTKPVLIEPWIAGVEMVIGILLLSLAERQDKRKVYFAHPTENEYHPLGLFAIGSVITLGAGIGWFLQALPGKFLPAAIEGVWLVIWIGIACWLLSLVLAWIVNLFMSKQTFDQVYLGVAIAMLPLALLPLQSMGNLEFLQAGKIVAEHRLDFLPMVLGGLAGVSTLSLLVVGMLRIRKQPVELNLSGEEVFRAFMLILAIPVLLYAVAFDPAGCAFNPAKLVGALDFFQEGEVLGAAQAIQSGRLPFQEVLLRHGFLSDAMSGIVATQLFGVSVEAYRYFLVLLAPLGLVAVYLVGIFCLPWLWALLIALLLVTGNLGSISIGLMVFPLCGFVFTLLYLQREKWLLLLVSGLFTVLALISSYTAGLIALSGHLCLLVGWVIAGSSTLKQRWLGLGVYTGMVIVSLIPWMIYLALTGSLAAYFENIGLLSQFHTVFCLPFPGFANPLSLAQLGGLLLPVVALLVGIWMIIEAWQQRKASGFVIWNVLLLVAVIAILWGRFLNRSQATLLSETVPLAAMLLAFFVYRMLARQRPMRALFFLLLLPGLFFPRPGIKVLTELAGNFGTKTQLVVDGLVEPKAERLKQLYLSPASARQLDQAIEYIGSQVSTTDRYYDFSNQPLFYFLIPRQPITRDLSSITNATWEQQLETVRNLNRSKVAAVLFESQAAADHAWDRLPAFVRQYAVSEYLLQKYTPVKLVGDVVVLLPAAPELFPEPEALSALPQKAELFALARLWGDQGKYNPAQGSSTARYLLPTEIKAMEAAGQTVTAKGEQWEIQSARRLKLVLTKQSGNEPTGNVLLLELTGRTQQADQLARLSWKGEKLPGTVSFTVRADQQAHRYIIRVNALPFWVYAGKIEQLELELPAGNWVLQPAQLLRFADIPELVGVKPAVVSEKSAILANPVSGSKIPAKKKKK